MLPLPPNANLLDRMVLAVERVRDRLNRATSVLEAAGISYAVIGGNAAAAWIATIDESAVRSNQKIEILIRRSDFDSAKNALESAGFVASTVDRSLFLDGHNVHPRHSVQFVFANERLSPKCYFETPDVSEAKILSTATFRVLDLEPLVRMNLDSFKLDERVDLEDLIDVDLVNPDWKSRLDPRLSARLQHLIDTPGG